MGELQLPPNEVEIGCFQRWVLYELATEVEQQQPILAGIGVGDGGNFGWLDRLPWLGQQPRMQLTLGPAGIGGRCQFRACQIRLEKVIADQQAAAGIAIEQMMSAR